MPEQSKKLNPEDVFFSSILAAPIGALAGGVVGILGNHALSFFNTPLASSISGFSAFAAIGAIALPLQILPKYLTDHFINNSKFLQKHPELQGFIKDTTDVLLCLGAITTAALVLGTPLAASVISMMIIPAAIYLVSTLCRAINACIGNSESVKAEEAVGNTCAV